MCFLCLSAFFFDHKIVVRKKKKSGCEEHFSSCSDLDAISQSKSNVLLVFSCNTCSFV